MAALSHKATLTQQLNICIEVAHCEGASPPEACKKTLPSGASVAFRCLFLTSAKQRHDSKVLCLFMFKAATRSFYFFVDPGSPCEQKWYVHSDLDPVAFILSTLP